MAEIGLEAMTLRDHFAAEAMNGMLAETDVGHLHSDIADAAYHQADAMLAVRGQKTELRKSHERLQAACNESLTLFATMQGMPPALGDIERLRNTLENVLQDSIHV